MHGLPKVIKIIKLKQHGEDTLYCYGHNQYERDKLANLNNEKLEGIKSC